MTVDPNGSGGQFRRLAVLIAVNFVDMIGFMIVLPLLPFYALKLHASPEMIGGMIASFSIAQLVSAPLWGRVSDRYGRRPALLIGLSASAIAYVVFGFADSVWLFFASRLVQGAGGGTTGVAQAYVADTIEPKDRARALGWLSAATSAGVMLGPVVGSASPRIWAERRRGSWRRRSASSTSSSPGAGCPNRRKKHEGPPRVRRPVWHPAWMAVKHPLEPVARFLWIYAVGMLAFSSMTSVMALYLGATFGLDERTIGYVFLYVGVLSFTMRSLLLGPIVDRIGESWAMRIGTLLLIAGLLLYPAP